MCHCNDSGNIVMQKTLWWDTVYIGKKISTHEIHHQLMVVFGDGVLRPHHLWRGCSEFKSGLASIMMIAPLISADQEKVNSTSGGTGFGNPTKHNSRFIHCTGMICENYAKLLMYNWDSAV